MSDKTQDNVSYDFSSESSFSEQAEKPYLKKELLYVIDNNGSSDYSRNQVTFETVSLSNNGRWADYKNGFISIPLVCVLTRSHDDVDAANGQKMLNFKSSNVNIIDSVIVDYGNDNVIQQNANVNAYLTFKQHTEMSVNDILINDHLGYRKDSTAWNFSAAGGMRNNTLSESPFKHHTAGQELLLSNASVKESGENTYVRHSGLVHVFYYDCLINLKDLLFFEKMPLVRGGNFKITLNLNQSESVITYAAAGAVTSVVNTLKGSSNFALRTDVRPAPDTRTETISVKAVTNGVHNHQKRQCRLYVPIYSMAPMAEKNYISKALQTMIYDDVYVQHVKKQHGNFQVLLTNSLARMKRLVIVPMLSKYVQGGVSIDNPQESCLSTEPSTCSPSWIKDFNVQLSGSNIYQQNVQYKYESFLNELNGKYGLNANLETGLCSSLIGMADYNANYGYIVVDLSRRLSYDEGTPLSVQIQGVIASAKELDLLCFITYSKTMSIDLSTGAKVENPKA
jgi:hypothetical protein